METQLLGLLDGITNAGTTTLSYFVSAINTFLPWIGGFVAIIAIGWLFIKFMTGRKRKF